MKFYRYLQTTSLAQLQSPSTYMLFAVFSVSLSSFFAKLSMTGIGIHATVFIRFFIPLILIIFVLVIFRPSIKLQLSSFKLNIVRSFSLIASQLLLFLAIQGLPLSEAILLYNTGPIIITLFSFFLGYKIEAKECIGLALGAIGVLLICNVQEGVLNKYVLYGVLSGIAFSISQLSLYIASKKEDNLVIMFYLYLFTSFLAFILYLLFDDTVVDISTFEYPFLICLFSVGFFSLANQYFRGKAYKKAQSPSSLAPLIYFSVLFTGILDFIFFARAPDAQSIAGGLLIFIGSYITLGSATKFTKKAS